MDNERREKVEHIETAIQESAGRKKDFWDRASVITTFLSSVVIAGLIGWWTYAASKTEQQINQLRLDHEAVMAKYDLELKRLQQRTDEID